LELVGEQNLLQRYLTQSRQWLDDVRVVFLRGQEAAIEARLETAELKEALALEQRKSSPHGER